MLHAMAERVRETGADVGVGFDGDGDRCGVVDNNGVEIFADKMGVLLAGTYRSATKARRSWSTSNPPHFLRATRFCRRGV